MGMALIFYGEGSDLHKSKRSLLRWINSMEKINLGARWSGGWIEGRSHSLPTVVKEASEK